MIKCIYYNNCEQYKHPLTAKHKLTQPIKFIDLSSMPIIIFTLDRLYTRSKYSSLVENNNYSP